jgi:hypothetical protein
MGANYVLDFQIMSARKYLGGVVLAVSMISAT